jgi:hypothetical protein
MLDGLKQGFLPNGFAEVVVERHIDDIDIRIDSSHHDDTTLVV